MRFRPALHGLLSAACAACVCLAPSGAAGADRTAVACIQSAEQGETARNAGELLRARELFTQCSARECPAVLRHDCGSWLEDTTRQIPSVVLGAHDAQGRDIVDARASVDGTLVRERLDGGAIELDPGSHVVRFEGAGTVPAEIHVVLRTGEKNRAILATLAPPAPPPPPRPPPAAAVSLPPPAPPTGSAEPGRHVPAGAWVLGGLGVAALGVFGAFGAVGASDARTLRNTCAPGCSDPQVQDVRIKLVTADVALGVGVVSLVAAAWIGIRGLTRSRDVTAGQLFVAPSVSGLAIRF